VLLLPDKHQGYFGDDQRTKCSGQKRSCKDDGKIFRHTNERRTRDQSDARQSERVPGPKLAADSCRQQTGRYEAACETASEHPGLAVGEPLFDPNKGRHWSEAVQNQGEVGERQVGDPGTRRSLQPRLGMRTLCAWREDFRATLCYRVNRLPVHRKTDNPVAVLLN
jgi:hypothetical protein